jgi:glycosyltransferase involved in cell wall biosynthesis
MSSRSSVSFYFYTGDFDEVIRRHDAGGGQIYSTHGELVRLIRGLADAGVTVTVNSFLSARTETVRIDDRITVNLLGGKQYNDDDCLLAAVAADKADLLVAHFPNLKLLNACVRTGRPMMAVLASSYNKKGLRYWLERIRLRRALNRPEIELVMNHCEPSTRRLEHIGVNRRKLVAWDIPHEFSPTDQSPKTVIPDAPHKLFFVGSICADKGCREIIHAVKILRDRGIDASASFAGKGDIEEMESLASELGIKNQVQFLGLIDNREVFEGFANATIAVVPSRTDYPEGFPLTMFEAIASRTPIVCSDHPVFMPIMEHRETAMIFPAGDHNALAASVETLLQDKELYCLLSANADRAWDRLKGPADWRTFLQAWVLEGKDGPTISNILKQRLA